jgi:hypothetical protein
LITKGELLKMSGAKLPPLGLARGADDGQFVWTCPKIKELAENISD